MEARDCSLCGRLAETKTCPPCSELEWLSHLPLQLYTSALLDIVGGVTRDEWIKTSLELWARRDRHKGHLRLQTWVARDILARASRSGLDVWQVVVQLLEASTDDED